jgi:hypothetical protein
MKFAHAIGRVLESVESRAGRWATFGTGITIPFDVHFPAGGPAVTVGLWPPQASHKASAARTMSAAVLWCPAPTASLMEGGRRMRNMARNRSVSGETPGGRCCLSFPMRMLGLRPCMSMGSRSNSK